MGLTHAPKAKVQTCPAKMSHLVGYGETPPVPLCPGGYSAGIHGRCASHRTIYPVEFSDHHMQVRPSKTHLLDARGSGISPAYGFPGLYRMVTAPVEL